MTCESLEMGKLGGVVKREGSWGFEVLEIYQSILPVSWWKRVITSTAGSLFWFLTSGYFRCSAHIFLVADLCCFFLQALFELFSSFNYIAVVKDEGCHPSCRRW